MEEFFKNEIRLIECYRGSAPEERENCNQYAENMKKLFEQDGGMTPKNALKSKWVAFNSK